LPAAIAADQQKKPEKTGKLLKNVNIMTLKHF
jgi:hypothetical protein